jgi:hypothetical protein
MYGQQPAMQQQHTLQAPQRDTHASLSDNNGPASFTKYLK